MAAGPRSPKSLGRFAFALFLATLVLVSVRNAGAQSAAPSTYSAYTGIDVKVPPPTPALGPANSVFIDPTFGSRILRVTDQNTMAARSFIPTDSGFHRTWNANSTAIKLTGPNGDGYWLEFNPSTFKVGDGSSSPAVHPLTTLNANWEWSAVNPDVMYFLNGSQIGQYNKSTGVISNLGGPSNGDPTTYTAVVVGADQWICSAAGAGIQDTYTKLFCVAPSNPSTSKFIDVANRTINGVVQTDPNWPTSASGQTIGIHSISGGAGPSWLGVTFHQQSWGGNGDAVLNLNTNTWSLLTTADLYWSGHNSLGNGRFVNGGGSIDGKDSRGAIVRNPDNLMNPATNVFIMQPPSTVNWYDGEHSSWFNSASNPNAPVLFSRYDANLAAWQTWNEEIIVAAIDGSNTVWRFAHTHCCSGAYYSDAFAQISNDGNWALFSSYWDGTLGAPGIDGGFGIATRIDTFIVQLAGHTDRTPPTVSMTAPVAGSILTGVTTISAAASDDVGVTSLQFQLDGANLGPQLTVPPYSVSWTPTSAQNGLHTLTAVARDAAGNSATSIGVAVTVSVVRPLAPTGLHIRRS